MMAKRVSLEGYLRELFCAEMRRRGNTNFGDKPITAFDGGKDAYGTTHSAVWGKIATTIRDHAFDPVVYISLAFWSITRFPGPRELASTLMIERYKQYVLNTPKRLATMYKSSTVLINTLLRELDNCNYDDNTKIILALHKHRAKTVSDLMHYCFAVAAGQQAVAEPYRRLAIRELAFHPAAYRDAWPAGFIPDDIFNEAVRIRDNLEQRMRQYA